MRFPPSFLDEIRARLPVSEVVRRRVKLKKSGREFVGLSPFGQERTPSFFVNDQKMAWFDFSSGKNGNVFDFVMETEGLSFPETVERLAGEAGLALPARSPDAERREQRRAGLHEVLDWAAAFFRQSLAGGGGAKARAYLDGRSIAAASRDAFGIGYAPNGRHELRDALAAKGASVETMCEAGLLVHGDEIAVPYDRFRDRVMFPIHDRSGRVIAFGGRALEKDATAKYLNSPETPLFHKGSVLFNHHRARKAAHDKGRVIAVEGYVDVVAMHAAGFPETVAGLGTALTEDQAGLLWQMAPQPLLCFDGDKAGRKAAGRAAEMALPLIGPERTFAFALLPDGQDPDELIRAAGATAMEQALGAAMPFVDLVWSRALEGRALATPEQRAALEHEVRALAAAIRDEALRPHYRVELDKRVRALFGMPEPRQGGGGERRAAGRPPFRPDRQNGVRRGAGRGGAAPERTGLLSAPVAANPNLLGRFQGVASVPPREADIMLLLLAHPDLIADHAEELAALDLGTGGEVVALRDRLLDLAHDGIESVTALRENLTAAGFAALLGRLDRSCARTHWYLRPEAATADAAHVLRQALTLQHRARALHRELMSAEAALAIESCEANVARIVDIKEQISALAGSEAAIEGFGSSSGRSGSAL